MSTGIFKDFKNLEEKTDFIIAIIVILLAGALIGYFTFSSPFIEQVAPAATNNNEIESIIIEDQQYTPLVVEEEKESRTRKRKIKEVEPLPIKTSLPTVDPAEEVSVKEILPETTPPTSEINNITSEVITSEIVEKEDLEPVENIAEGDLAVGGEDLPSLTEISTKEETTIDTAPVTKSAPVVTEEEKSCIILIGTFRESQNITKLYHSLLAENYKVFQKPFQGLTRMGVYYDCQAADLQEQLSNIQKKYAEDAMILERN